MTIKTGLGVQFAAANPSRGSRNPRTDGRHQFANRAKELSANSQADYFQSLAGQINRALREQFQFANAPAS
jgi:hypothetical protein